MKKNVILFVMVVLFMTLFAGLSFAENDDVSLSDAIEILQVLTGSDHQPAFNATGTWAVQSSPMGIIRTGEVFLDMMPDGKVTGYAELTSLDGLSNVKGQVNGFSFDLEMTSEYGAIVVHGDASSDGQNINGIFHPKDAPDSKILWEGYRQTTTTTNGTYEYDTQENKLFLSYENSGTLQYNITKFTETIVALNNIEWERNVPGEVGTLIGVWRNDQASNESIMTFKPDGTFSSIQKRLDK